jgi:transposase
MPRPSKLTDAVVDQIVIAVKGMSTFKVAAQYAGVGETTFYRWVSRGRAECRRLAVATDQLDALPKRPRSEKARKVRLAALRAAQPRAAELPYLEFVERIERADAEAQVRAAAQIAAAGAKHWRACAVRLMFWFRRKRFLGSYFGRGVCVGKAKFYRWAWGTA